VAADYNVFISWSGERSLVMARGLYTWLPRIINAARPWMSQEDIAKGTHSNKEIMKAARAIKLGIVCLTAENLTAPWMLFEAGALSKAVEDDGLVCTLLSPGLEQESVEPPLSIFQWTKAEKVDLRRMLRDLNNALGAPVKEPDLDATFDAMWPKLEEAIRREPEAQPAPAKRSEREILNEILELVRGLSRRSEGSPLGAAFMGELEALVRTVDNWPGPRGTYFASAPIGSPGVPGPSGNRYLRDLLPKADLTKAPGEEDKP
jgi:hypothetical protein